LLHRLLHCFGVFTKRDNFGQGRIDILLIGYLPGGDYRDVAIVFLENFRDLFEKDLGRTRLGTLQLLEGKAEMPSAPGILDYHGSRTAVVFPDPVLNHHLQGASAGYHGKKLYPRHLEKTFKAAINEGKTLRIQFKKLV
jgi:hypothetical protein